MRFRGGIGLVVLAIALTGCGIWPYPAPDAATVVIRTQQVGCCYIEGALHYGRLDGPTRGEFSLDGGAELGGDLRDPIPIGEMSLTIAPGHYELTVGSGSATGTAGSWGIRARRQQRNLTSLGATSFRSQSSSS